MKIGKQEKGSSNFFTKRMALEAIASLERDTSGITAADIGSGAGELTRLLCDKFGKVYMVDVYSPQSIPEKAEFVSSDLNLDWGLPDNSVDFAFCLEVIEHVENPRHFFRQLQRILKPGGYAFITTPNNHSIYSKLIFLFKGEHRYFQDPSYPAHITALMKKDFMRISEEHKMKILNWSWANEDALPFWHFRLRLPGKLFSQSIGVLTQKQP